MIHDQILRGDIEVGLVAKAPSSKRFEVEPYSTHKLVAFVHADHPFARKGSLTPSELARAPLVLRGGLRIRSAAEAVLEQRGYKPNVAVRCDTPEGVRMAVRNKGGIGILLYDAVKTAVERGEFKLLRTPGLVIEAKSFILYRKDRPLSANATDFLALLRKEKPNEKESEKICGGGGKPVQWIEARDAATLIIAPERRTGDSRLLGRSPAGREKR